MSSPGIIIALLGFEYVVAWFGRLFFRLVMRRVRAR